MFKLSKRSVYSGAIFACPENRIQEFEAEKFRKIKAKAEEPTYIIQVSLQEAITLASKYEQNSFIFMEDETAKLYDLANNTVAEATKIEIGKIPDAETSADGIDLHCEFGVPKPANLPLPTAITEVTI